MQKPNFYAILPASIRYDSDLSSSEKLFYAEITAMAQKEGYCWASNSYFSNLFSVSISTVSLWVNHLARLNHVKLEYIKEGNQLIQRNIYPIQKTRIPHTENQKGGTQKTRRGYSENQKDINTSTNNTSNNNTSRGQKFTPPSVKEVWDYCQERQNVINAEKFVNFYTSKNWMVGKNKMKDWKAAVRSWEITEKEKSSAKKESYMDKLKRIE